MWLSLADWLCLRIPIFDHWAGIAAKPMRFWLKDLVCAAYTDEGQTGREVEKEVKTDIERVIVVADEAAFVPVDIEELQAEEEGVFVGLWAVQDGQNWKFWVSVLTEDLQRNRLDLV